MTDISNYISYAITLTEVVLLAGCVWDSVKIFISKYLLLNYLQNIKANALKMSTLKRALALCSQFSSVSLFFMMKNVKMIVVEFVNCQLAKHARGTTHALTNELFEQY